MSRLLLGVLLVAIILTCVACQEHVEKEGWDGVGFFLGEKSASQLQMVCQYYYFTSLIIVLYILNSLDKKKK